MACQVEQVADCGDVATLARALFIPDKEDTSWLSQCVVSISSCGNLLAVGYRSRLCLLTTQWISSSDSSTYLISWSGTMPSEVTAVAALPICPSQQSSQNGPDWFCILVGFKNGSIGFYTNTGHLLFTEKLDERPVLRVSCHTGTYGTLPDDIYILFQNSECVISGSSLFQTLRYAKAQLARVQAGVLNEYTVDDRSIQIRKWAFNDQDVINDAGVVGLELRNTYDHLLAASTYGGYDTWYRSIPPANTLILGAGSKPYIGFHYALEGGTTPPLQDVARAVANRIKSALPGWLGGGGSTESPQSSTEPKLRAEPLSMRSGLCDSQRQGMSIAISPDRRLAAFADNLGRVAVLDVSKGHLVRLFKGYRDAQCAFMQVFEQDTKKPQLSTIKETRRAIFLIIYNPKKGLIDIRLMQRGNRVAVFTATKNGKLLYNTCGLVGAEQNYTHKKLNLPEFQCVLIDPDGKLKRFNIPFFFALEGEHSERSKDLHILRDMRECLKRKCQSESDKEEIFKKAAELKILDLKKHCLEMLYRNYSVPPSIVMECLEIFWDSMVADELDDEGARIKNYFRNLVFITLFYRRINNENTEDMGKLIDKVGLENRFEKSIMQKVTETEPEFHLLEDDNCILERLLMLAQEKDYKKHQHSRVTFADNLSNTYKEFVSCFDLEGDTPYVPLKSEVTLEKLGNLASYTFKAIFKIEDLSKLNDFMNESSIDPREMVKLIIVHVMNMSLEDISIELIEKLIAVLYYVCMSNAEASNIAYNATSPWWQQIRDLLVEMPCPLRSMIVAMACKAVAKTFEENTATNGEDAWESVTKENAKWGMLIGKLEDISILSIILLLKGSFNGKSLPKLYGVDFEINLKYVYTRGKGSVTELISKWLCSMGVLPEAIVANDLMDRCVEASEVNATADDDIDTKDDVFLEENRKYVDDNPQIFKWLSLLRQQFPFSTSPDYIIANMCWEYAIAWQKNVQETEKLSAVIDCLKNISDLHLQLGVCSIVWTTYIKQCFETSCRLVNKVGKLPKERLCVQDVGLTDVDMVKFLEIATTYLDYFLKWSTASIRKEKLKIQYEKIWDQSMPSLVEVAQDTNKVNEDILNLNYQVSCTIYYQCHFNLKVTKPLNNLFDVDYHYIFEGLTGKVEPRDINMKPSDKLKSPRMKYLNKVLRAALELITCEDISGPYKRYNVDEYMDWIDKIHNLAELWYIDSDFIKRQQVVGLYHLGYDQLAEEWTSSVRAIDQLLHPILGITAQRLKRHLEQCETPAEWIAAMPPNLVMHLNTMELDPSVPAHTSLESTVSVLQTVLNHLQNCPLNSQNIKLAELMVRGCKTLLEMKL